MVHGNVGLTDGVHLPGHLQRQMGLSGRALVTGASKVRCKEWIEQLNVLPVTRHYADEASYCRDCGTYDSSGSSRWRTEVGGISSALWGTISSLAWDV